IHVADAAARVRREAPCQDRAHVRIARIGDHAFLEAARDLDALAEEEALGQLFLQSRRAIAHLGFDLLREFRPDARRLAVFAVFVEALAGLAARAALLLHDPREQAAARILLVVLARRFGGRLADLQRSVETDAVGYFERPHGHAALTPD